MLIVVFIFIGLTGHDPWKQDETYIFGIVQHLIESGDWVIPMVAGEPFMEKPPLYYWLAAGLAQVLASWLPLHDGARLASGCFMGVSCLASGFTSRKMWGTGAGITSVLVLLGCLGVAMYSHFMVTDLAVMTGFALCLAAFPYALSRPVRAGLLLGCGTGVGFLGKGLLLPGIVGLSCLLLPALFPAWRKRPYFQTLGIAAIVSTPAILIWPIQLYLRSPDLFYEWFWMNNVGRFLGFSVSQLGAPHRPWYWLGAMPWLAFPALPLAALTLWRRRRVLIGDRNIQCLVTCSVVYMATLVLAASAREAYALPLMVALGLLAAPTASTLPKSIDLTWAAVSAVSFGLAASMIWTVWIYAALNQPLVWGWLNRQILVDPGTAVVDFNFWIGLLLTGGAILIAGYAFRSKTMTGLVTWVTGLTLCWGLLSALWLPWIDTAKSYRQVFQSMALALPKGINCMASTGLGESERAMLHYILGIDTKRTEKVGEQNCSYVLIEGLAKDPPQSPMAHDKILLWEGARQRDTRERFWLFGKP